MKSIETRLQCLEARFKRDPLMLLCSDGVVRTACNAIADGIAWCRVVSGSDLFDLDMMLAEIRNKAKYMEE